MNNDQEKWREEAIVFKKRESQRGKVSHGMMLTPTHYTWAGMRCRCSNPKHVHYAKYGGRGIKVCEKWQTFLGFFEDMGERPIGKELDRIDNNGDYCLENCRWTDKSQNGFNSTKTKKSALPRGVTAHEKGFIARISADGVLYHIGKFKSAEMANEAYLKMCLEWYGRLPPEKHRKNVS